jgi:hypothetical protein
MVSRVTNVELLGAVVERIKIDMAASDYSAMWILLSHIPRKDLLAYLPDDEEGICEACNGSGEGMHEDTTCHACKGSGES